TFSKVLFPGLRIGYAVVPERLLARMVALRSQSDRQPPTFAEAALTDRLREGHFSAHLRRARRSARMARDGLVSGLRSGSGNGLEVAVPDQGLHLIAQLSPDARDVELSAAAKAAGIGTRPLSSMYVSQPPRQGLVIGFSGFASEDLHLAGSRLAALIGGSGT